MSNIGKFKTLFLYIASFAVVLEAVPQFYTGRYNRHHHQPAESSEDIRPQENRRFIREPEFDGYNIDDRQNYAEFYEPIYDSPRYPRSGEIRKSNSVFVEVEPNDQDFYEKINAGPESIYRKSGSPIVRYHPPTANTLYVVRSADPANENLHANEGNLSFDKKSAHRFNPFPISMTRPDSALVNNARSLTDEELGKVVRKAITAARHAGDSTKTVVPTKRFSQSMIRKPLEDSELAYRPRIGSIYANEFVPEINMAGITPPGEINEPEDRLSTDFIIEKGFSLDNDAVATIGEEMQNVEEVHPDHVPDVSLSETEPEVYQFVDDVERDPEETGDNIEEDGSSDDAIEGDVVLSVIEEDDGKDFEQEVKDEVKHNVDVDAETESSALLETETPASTTENYKIERYSSLGVDDVDQRPPITSETSSTDEPITDPSTTPAAEKKN